jgi:hypothetical protein
MKKRLVLVFAVTASILSLTIFAQNAPRTPAQNPQSTAAQNARRTSDGKPDFSGLWESAAGGGGGAGQQVSIYQGGTAPRQLTRRERGLRDTSVPLAEWGREAFLYYTAGDGEYGGETGGPGDPRYHGGQCGGPKSPSDLGTNLQVFQSPQLLMLSYASSQPWIRKIWIGKQHPKDITDYVPFWMGHSVGRWEADTLVVDTVRIKEGTLLSTGRALPQSGNLHMIERFHFDNNGNLRVDRTFEDPVAYLKPWTDSLNLRSATNLKDMYDGWEIEENHAVCQGGVFWAENDPWFENYDKIKNEILPHADELKKGPPPVPEKYRQK